MPVSELERAKKAASRSAGPPRLPFSLTIGVTGHRLDLLAADAIPRIEQRIGAALTELVAAGAEILAREADFYTSDPPRFTLVSPLADGTDQIAAEVALAQGFHLQTVLPFERAVYSDDFPDDASRAKFEALLARADCVLELPGERDDPLDAYIQGGRATVAHCDVLIAVWDGLPARGRGGTGEVVEVALRMGTPIIHLPTDPAHEAELLWSAFDPAVVTAHGSATVRRQFNRAEVDELLTAMLTPPRQVREREFAKRFLSERSPGVRWRVEYPLLLSLAGTHRFGRRDWSSRPGAEAARKEWDSFAGRCVDCHGVSAGLDPLQVAYEWSDRLATHYAQTYRSGHVFNFLFAALSVLIGLSGLLFHGVKIALASAEFAVILLILFNTRFGTSRCWHQRWLDYRQLAERLRPMRSLKLLGVAAPDAPGDRAEPVARRWIDWYAAAMWRAIGCPIGRIDRPRAASLARAIGAAEIEPQIAYNRASAAQAEHFDHRLELLATLLFAATVVGCVAAIVSLAIDPHWLDAHGNLLTFFSAGLPAIGTAIFGIRVQGDYGGAAARSRSTADQLERIARELARGPQDLGRSADLVEQAARLMLADLGAWRLIHEQHELSVA